MNWQAITFDWNQIRAFLVTAEEGSLSAAARALGVTQPTLSRQVAALEQELGVVLFERSGRSLILAPSGAELLEQVRLMGNAAHRVSLIASGQSQSIEGQVRITASDVLSAYVLPPILKELRTHAPRLSVDVVAANDIRDLMRREADIAIRHIRPEQPDLVARLVQEARANFYAADSYLATRGTPKSKVDLSVHDFISFGDPDELLAFLAPRGVPVTRQNFPIGSQSGVVAWQYAVQGLGIAVMSDEVAAQFPNMIRLLPDDPPITFPIWLTTHREIHTSRRIRLVFDLLARHLSA